MPVTIETIKDLAYYIINHKHDGTPWGGGAITSPTIIGNITLGAGNGIILKSPDGTRTQLVSLGNDGLVAYTDQ